jgi:hypothetical protein
MKSNPSSLFVGRFFKDPSNNSWRWVHSSPAPGFLVSTPVGSDNLPDNNSQRLDALRNLGGVEFFAEAK